ncbi:MAG: hypothetical protein LBM26_05140 [Methanobrevibacter sp.]|jgi:hypothetical protein|nr:hypothetical protein [Methanobrevibacter sp.]
MSKNVNLYYNNERNDLRKRTNLNDVMFFNQLSIQACMVILCVFAVVLFSVLSIATAPNPSVLFGI